MPPSITATVHIPKGPVRTTVYANAATGSASLVVGDFPTEVLLMLPTAADAHRLADAFAAITDGVPPPPRIVQQRPPVMTHESAIEVEISADIYDDGTGDPDEWVIASVDLTIAGRTVTITRDNPAFAAISSAIEAERGDEIGADWKRLGCHRLTTC